MQLRALSLAFVAAASAAAPATAHHSFAVHFVADRLVTVRGTVSEFSFRNPHGVVQLTAKADNGAEQQWKIETNSPNILRRRGWTEPLDQARRRRRRRRLSRARRLPFHARLSRHVRRRSKRESTCNAPSAAFLMQAPFPMEIYQSDELIVLKMDYFDLVRVVHLDGRSHPQSDAPHSRAGHSVGRWETDTLVVDTTHLAPGTFMNNGFNHSADLAMTERFRMSSDGSTLWLAQMYEDAAVFSGVAARYMAWTRRPGEHVYPFDCDPSYGE